MKACFQQTAPEAARVNEVLLGHGHSPQAHSRPGPCPLQQIEAKNRHPRSHML